MVYLDALVKEAVEHADKVGEWQCSEDPPLPVGVDALRANRAGQSRQVLCRRLLQTIQCTVHKLFSRCP
jgi:hypothetical protein